MQPLQFNFAHEYTDTEIDTPSGRAWKYHAHSSFYWFTEFCYSACLSHFAAPFIIIPAKASNAENCVGCYARGTTSFEYWVAPTTEDTQISATSLGGAPSLHTALFLFLWTAGNCMCASMEKSNCCILQRVYSQHLFTPSWSCGVQMILPQVHLRKPCYDFSFL